jgi:hypothetical protein
MDDGASKRPHHALKHGGYSALRLLPGEDDAEFKKLRTEIGADLQLAGALEQDIGDTIAKLAWRKRNMGIFAIAERARRRRRQIIEDTFRQRNIDVDGKLEAPLYQGEAEDIEARKEAEKEAAAVARTQIGQQLYEWIVSEAATVDGLFKDVEIEERLNAAIGKCLKQLMILRGVKSLTESSHFASVSNAKDVNCAVN